MSLIVTDHAVMRLRQRGFGSALLAELEATGAPLRDAVCERLMRAFCAAQRLGQTRYHVTIAGLRFVIRDEAVVTVLAPEHQHHARKNGIARTREVAGA